MGNTLSELAEEAHANAKRKGWHEWPLRACGQVYVDRVLAKLALVMTEVCEGVEEARDQRWGIRWERDKHGQLKPEGFVVELADVIIRVMDTAEALGLDLEDAVNKKMEFNRMRQHRHGGRSA